jgi:alkylation response protein AidB-like acyl-CoA dehydrogenase
VTRVPDDSDRVADRLREVVSEFTDLPHPGGGKTWERFEAFVSLAAEDLSLARLAEGHADALAILVESGRRARQPGASYGVWAARGGAGGVSATPVRGGWKLSGRKPFCSGSGLLDRALVTAESPDGYRLFDVATAQVVVDTVPDSWPAVGMADSRSETVVLGGAVVSEDDAIGPPGFYTDRAGFWFGACGVAACWSGGARGLVAGVVDSLSSDPGELILMELGRAVSDLRGMQDALESVATAIDGDPEDELGEARSRALAVRQIVHDACQRVLTHTAAAGGARPLCLDAGQAQRAADLYVYLSQHHGAADAAGLGRLAVGDWRRIRS